MAGMGQLSKPCSGLQVAQEANHAARALQQAVQAAPGGRQPLLRALCPLPQLGMLRYRLAVHLQRHTQQRLQKTVGG